MYTCTSTQEGSPEPRRTFLVGVISSDVSRSSSTTSFTPCCSIMVLMDHCYVFFQARMHFFSTASTHDCRLFPIVRTYQCNDMSRKPYVIKNVKHQDVDVANAVESLTIGNGNYEYSFTHWKRFLNDVLDAT